MATHSAHQRPIAPAQPSGGLIGRATMHVRQLLCGLHGHDALLHFEQGHMSLACVSCGYETPGWDLNGAPPRAEAPAVGQPAVRLPLVGQRRVA